jgi:hypothetical protein
MRLLGDSEWAAVLSPSPAGAPQYKGATSKVRE